MKALLPLLLTLPMAVFAQTKPSIRALEEKNGFRDVQLGSDSASLAGRVLVSHKGDSYIYRRPADNLQIGGATASLLTYTYYKGRLSTVTAVADGATNATALKDALEAQYSWGIPPNAYTKTYFWQTKRVKMVYDMGATGEHGMLFIFSREVIDQQEKDEKAQAKKADL